MDLTTGMAFTSNVLRVAVSKVRMPRSHRSICVLPRVAMYSAACSHSSIVEDMPRFSITGTRVCPTSFSREKFVMFRAPI